MSFSALKKSNFQDLLSKAENLNKSETKAGPDERLWKPEVDKAGNGYAVIRFLPAPDGEDSIENFGTQEQRDLHKEIKHASKSVS